MKNKHLLGLKDFPSEDIKTIIDTSFSFKEVLNRPIKKVPSLQGKTIVNLFFENSTRTRISFELAQKRLSADTVNFSASSSSLSKGETFKDTAQNIEAMKIDAVVMRHPNPGAALHLTNYIDSIIDKIRTKQYFTNNNWKTEWYIIAVFCTASKSEKEK